MKTKKVIMITRYFYPIVGGIVNHVYEIAKRLIKSGWDVEVFTLQDTFENKDNLKDKDNLNGIKIRRFRSFFQLVKELDYNAIIYINNFIITLTFLVFVEAVLRKMKNKKNRIVLVPHGGYTPWWGGFLLPARIIKMFYHKTLGKFFINHFASKIIALSEWEKALLIKEGIKSDLIVVIPNGIEDVAFEIKKYSYNASNLHRLLPNRRYLVTLCRISREKNIDSTIKALSYFKNLDLVICGRVHDKEYYRYLKVLIKKLKLEDRVHFIGFVKGKNKYYFIDNAEAFILTSSFEADPLSVKEAMARGKVLIVSNSGGLPYIVKHEINGFIVNLDEKSIADGIKKAISLNEKERQKIREENIKESKKYNWDEVTKKIINLLKNL